MEVGAASRCLPRTGNKGKQGVGKLHWVQRHAGGCSVTLPGPKYVERGRGWRKVFPSVEMERKKRRSFFVKMITWQEKSDQWKESSVEFFMNIFRNWAKL